MSRSLHADTITELEKGGQYITHLIEFEFDGGTDRFTDAHQNLIYNSDTYIASAKFIGFGDVTETQKLEISSMTFTLSATSQTLLAVALASDTINRKIKLHRALLNPDTYTIINDPVLIYAGLVKAFAVSETDKGKTVLTWQTGSVLADFHRTAGRRTNQQDQEAYMLIRGLSGTDRGFEYAHQNNFDVKWGRP